MLRIKIPRLCNCDYDSEKCPTCFPKCSGKHTCVACAKIIRLMSGFMDELSNAKSQLSVLAIYRRQCIFMKKHPSFFIAHHDWRQAMVELLYEGFRDQDFYSDMAIFMNGLNKS